MNRCVFPKQTRKIIGSQYSSGQGKASTSARLASVPHRAKLVLLVEEIADSPCGLVTTLRRDFEVIIGELNENLRELLELIQPDVIIVDVTVFERFDWSKVHQQIRQIPHCPHVPILLLAPAGQLANRLRCLNRGAADYIPKPVVPEEVLVRTKLHCRLWLRQKRLLWHNRALQAEIEQQKAIQTELVSRLRPAIVVAVKREHWEIHFCSQPARQLIQPYYGSLPDNLLPEPLSQWIEESSTRQWQRRNHDGTLIFSYRRINHQAVVISLEEPVQMPASPNALCSLGLTPREAEVLFWIAAAKTSPEIAVIVGAAPTTIKKHVNRILEKLGVENRLSAALLANEILRSGEELYDGRSSRFQRCPGAASTESD
jgi:DNA-binding NarL/FixJ family response regulator